MLYSAFSFLWFCKMLKIFNISAYLFFATRQIQRFWTFFSSSKQDAIAKSNNSRMQRLGDPVAESVGRAS
jgi:hypothetical protein